VIGSIALRGWQGRATPAWILVADEATGSCQMRAGFDDLASGAGVVVCDERGRNLELAHRGKVAVPRGDSCSAALRIH